MCVWLCGCLCGCLCACLLLQVGQRVVVKLGSRLADEVPATALVAEPNTWALRVLLDNVDPQPMTVAQVARGSPNTDPGANQCVRCATGVVSYDLAQRAHACVCVCVCGVLRYGTQLSVPGASVPIDSAQPTDVFSRTAPLPMKGEELTAFFHEVVGDFTTRLHAGDLNGSVPRSRSEGIGMWLSCSVFKLLSVLVQFPAQASQFLSKVCCEAAHGMRWQCQCRA